MNRKASENMGKKAQETAEKTYVLKEAPRVRSDTFAECYANHCEVVRTPWDLQITFCKIVTPKPGEIALEERATIVLPYGQAKSLAKTLQDQLEQHEAKHGEIQLP